MNEGMRVEISCQKPAKVGVYSGYNGGRSTQLADVVAEFTDCGLILPCLIWARLSRDKDTGEESLTIEAGLPKGVKFATDEQRDEFKEIALASANVWFGYAAAERNAIMRLTEKTAASTATRVTLSAKDIAAIKAAVAKPTAVAAVDVDALEDAIVGE